MVDPDDDSIQEILASSRDRAERSELSLGHLRAGDPAITLALMLDAHARTPAAPRRRVASIKRRSATNDATLPMPGRIGQSAVSLPTSLELRPSGAERSPDSENSRLVGGPPRSTIARRQ